MIPTASLSFLAILTLLSYDLTLPSRLYSEDGDRDLLCSLFDRLVSRDLRAILRTMFCLGELPNPEVGVILPEDS